MNAIETRVRPDGDWYDEQTERWDALQESGWRFGKPPRREGFVGMLMWHPEREGALRVFYTTREQSFREIHTVLLEQCEAFATS